MSVCFCSECGKPLETTSVFCEHCGERFEAEEEKLSVLESKAPEAKVKKKLLIIGSFVVLLLFLTHTYIKSIITPEKQLRSIYEALHEGNGEQFLEAIHVDEDVFVDPKSVTDLLGDEEATDLFQEIEAAIQEVENTNLPRYIESSYYGDILKVEQESFLLIYKKVKVSALAFEGEIKTDLPSGQVAIGDKEWALKGENIKLGRFLPGSYDVLLTSEEPIKTQRESEITITSAADENILVLTKENHMVSLVAEDKNSLVIINGKETKNKVSEMQEVGPLFTEDAIALSIVKEVDGKKVKSDEIDVYPGQEANFEFDEMEDSEVTEKAGQFVVGFRNAYEKSLNQQDFSVIAPYLDEETVAYEELRDYIYDLKGEKYTYHFTKNEVKNTEIRPDGTIVVETYEVFDFINHQGQLTNYKREKEYFVEMDEQKEFKIVDIEIGETIRK